MSTPSPTPPSSSSTTNTNVFLALLPLSPSLVLLFHVRDPTAQTAIVTSSVMGLLGYLLTTALVPVVAEYTLKSGLFGKDLGKKGTSLESTDVPEALGLVSGVVFLVMTIFTQLLFAKNTQQQVIFNSALFSICFMIFLGFTDDTLNLKWRYKLILPTIASLPLLAAYSGQTALYVPPPFHSWLMVDGQLTLLGRVINILAVVDTEAHGKIIELGALFLVFMGLLAVFCTNAINIYAGINGLECGQSYVIACSVLFFKMYELSLPLSGTGSGSTEHQVFVLLLIIPFIGAALGLLRHNWFPARVFVGDTFCYFAGMTFAVIGIHGHFSKTLLVLFLPQIVNFIYSVPQLFRLIPCPRHRLPMVAPQQQKSKQQTGSHEQLLAYSRFPCEPHQYRWFKIHRDDTTVPNCTLICAVLRAFGPMHERTLCLTLLAIQVLCSAFTFYLRYIVLDGAPAGASQ